MLALTFKGDMVNIPAGTSSSTLAMPVTFTQSTYPNSTLQYGLSATGAPVDLAALTLSTFSAGQGANAMAIAAPDCAGIAYRNVYDQREWGSVGVAFNSFGQYYVARIEETSNIHAPNPPLTGSISGATNATPIVITSAAHGLGPAGSRYTMTISGVAGNTAANSASRNAGIWFVQVIDVNTFTLFGSVGNGAYVSGGTWTTTRTSGRDQVWQTSDYGTGSFGSHLRREFQEDGTYILNDKYAVRVIEISADQTALILGNKTDGGSVTAISLHSTLSMAGGTKILSDVTITGFGFPTFLFNQSTGGVKDGAGLFTTSGDDLGITVNLGTASLANSTTTSGSVSVTVSSTTGLVVGQPVFGTGVPLNATVASVVDGTHFTISGASTVTASNTLLTIPGYFNPIKFNADGTITANGTLQLLNPTTLNGATIQGKSNNYIYWISGDTNVPKTTSNAWYWLLPAWGFGQDGNMELHQVIGGVDVNVLSWNGSGTASFNAGLALKSGTNAKAGTFTLVSGVKTVANTSITANSVVQVTLKTASGTRAGNPDIVCAATTGFVATGAATDNGTYNYVVLEVN